MSSSTPIYNGVYQGGYEHFAQNFYDLWENDEEVMKKAKRVNDLYDTFLYMFDVKDVYELPPSAQEYLHERSKVNL